MFSLASKKGGKGKKPTTRFGQAAKKGEKRKGYHGTILKKEKVPGWRHFPRFEPKPGKGKEEGKGIRPSFGCTQKEKGEKKGIVPTFNIAPRPTHPDETGGKKERKGEGEKRESTFAAGRGGKTYNINHPTSRLVSKSEEGERKEKRKGKKGRAVSTLIEEGGGGKRKMSSNGLLIQPQLITKRKKREGGKKPIKKGGREKKKETFGFLLGRVLATGKKREGGEGKRETESGTPSANRLGEKITLSFRSPAAEEPGESPETGEKKRRDPNTFSPLIHKRGRKEDICEALYGNHEEKEKRGKEITFHSTYLQDLQDARNNDRRKGR